MQHYRRGCNNILSISQRTTPIARSLCEGWTPHDLHILVTAPFCCDRKFRAACAQSFAPWQQATIEITRRDHSIIACSRHTHIFLFFAHIPFVVNRTINATPPERLQQRLGSSKTALLRKEIMENVNLTWYAFPKQKKQVVWNITSVVMTRRTKETACLYLLQSAMSTAKCLKAFFGKHTI